MTPADMQTSARVRRVLIIEGLANMLVLLAKLAVGLATGSAAILGDALHSVTDLANNGVALFAAKISSSPPDSEHPYGHRKFEVLAVFALATLLTVVAIEIALRAVGRLGEPIDNSGWGLVVMFGVLAVNIAVSAWEGYEARRLDSDLLRADARHTFSDVLTTVAVIIGWQLAARGYPWLDPVVALLVSALVFYLAFDLFRRTIPSLVDQATHAPEEITEAILAVPHVQEVRRVRSRASGSGIAADVVVAVDGNLPTERAHLVADSIEAVLASKLGIHDVSVHIEPGPKT